MALNVKKTLMKADNLARKGDTAGAAALFQAVLDEFPGNKKAADGLAALNTAPKMNAEQARQFQLAMQDVVRLFNGGHSQQALNQALQLVRKFPREPVLHNLIGAASTDLKQYGRAISAYREAIRLQPDYAEAYSNLGAACNESGDHEGAISAYKNAIELEPGMQEAHNNLGNVYRDCGQLENALSCYRKAIELRPDFAAAHNNLGCALNDLGRYDEGAASCAEALRHRPGFSKARGMLLHQLALMCDWDAMAALTDLVPELGTEGEPVIPFELLHLDDNPARHLTRSRLFAAKSFASPPPPGFKPPPERPPKLKIGYFSGDFADHATMFLMIRMFELHDRERFEIHAFSSTPGDGGKMRKRLLRHLDGYHDIAMLGDHEAADLARQQDIHIAVDLKGYTQNSRLGAFAYRPAPVQVTYLGYPGTTGAPFMDYILADGTVIPPGDEQFYSEQVIRLPHSYQVNDDTRAIAAERPKREDVGLPEKGFVFCCFNNNNKISAREFDIWMRLLNEVEDSVLWLFRSNQWAGENLLAQAQKRGVEPQRIVFADKLPLDQHLARLPLADLFLDTFNYNAHTTSSDALWAGLPVLTKAGSSFSARVAASLLRAVGMPELVTASESEYEALALDLARDTERLAGLRQHLAQVHNTAPLFDSEATTRAIEQAYERIYQRFIDGEAPAHINL